MAVIVETDPSVEPPDGIVTCNDVVAGMIEADSTRVVQDGVAAGIVEVDSFIEVQDGVVCDGVAAGMIKVNSFITPKKAAAGIVTCNDVVAGI